MAGGSPIFDLGAKLFLARRTYPREGLVGIVVLMQSSEKRVVLISGASSGIGEAAATLLQGTGAVVYGLTSGPATLAAARERHPKIRWLSANVASRAEVSAAVETVVAEAGRLDTLVNNAGIYKFAPLEASDDAVLRSQFEVNVYGVVYLTQASLSALKKSRGSIVNVSSTSARKAMPDQSLYAATKAAVESLTRSWALELAPSGVRVNAIAPGPTETEGVARLPIPKEMFEVMKQHILKQVPLGRMATSEEVAQWIVTLSDPKVTWLTGQVLGIDGGLSVS